MKYYARYAHLKYQAMHKEGDSIFRGDIIGTMGNTGQSTGAHLHFDLIQKDPGGMYRLADIPGMITDLPELMKQYNFFIDYEMFCDDIKLTTSFGEPFYPSNLNTPPNERKSWKFHPAYDLVPKHKENNIIYWNRSKPGTVFKVGTDNGYGNYIIIRFEA